jgi:hypothetical protein
MQRRLVASALGSAQRASLAQFHLQFAVQFHTVRAVSLAPDRLLSPRVAYRYTPSAALRTKSTDPYELLGVSRSATAKEIKLAYFREAKKSHPDLNPNDPKAKEKFQQVSAAYELLSDEKRRAAYDATGRMNEPMHGAGSGDYGASSGSAQQHAEDIFNSVREDVDVIKEAFALYAGEVKDELQVAVECAKEGDWKGLWEIARDHKILILGIVVPTVVFLRYPPAVFFVLRGLWAMSSVALVGLLRSGNLATAARMVWQAIVKLSREQRGRVKKNRRRKP